MTSFRTSIAAGFSLLAVMAAGVAPAEAQLLTRSQIQAYEATRGQSQCPRTLDKSHQMVRQLTVATTRSRARAEANPVYWADVGYYEAQLAFAKSCVQSVAAVTR